MSQITSAIILKSKKFTPKTQFESGSESDEIEVMSARNLKQSMSKSNSKSGITEVGTLLDSEDDGVERDTILKSPPKGGKRLSSVVSRSQPSLVSLVLLYTTGCCCYD